VYRSATIFSIAAFIPLLVLGSLFIASLLQHKNQTTEDKTLERALSFVAEVDGMISSDLGALTVLTSSKVFATGDWQLARGYTEAVSSEFPHWKNVILANAVDGQLIWQTAALSDGVALTPPEVLTMTKQSASNMRGEILGAKHDCKCVMVRRRFTSKDSFYMLILERDVKDIQQTLAASVLPNEIAAVVDQNGSFIARTIDFDTRMGTPATQFVRDAVARGGSGVYSGTTFEGLHNRSAYATSNLSGWSAHIAVAATSYNILSAGYVTFGLLGLLTAFGFAGGMVWYAAQDLAKRRRAEHAQIRSQKLEAMGYLASAVAHDFNNLLAVMTACLRFLDRPIEQVKKDKLIVEGLAAAGRGEKLVRQLLSFARDKPMELDCVNLGNTYADIQDLLMRCLGPKIKIDVNFAHEARNVLTNAAQLELVLLNLAVNARDAMPDGGNFSITSKLAPMSGFIDLMVQDTGIGMTKEVAARALEPFFTTKDDGKGTGLGLAQAQLLMQQSGGSLHLETEPGKGALFILRLPICKPRLRAAA
jgi:signal transduction histidine kinase